MSLWTPEGEHPVDRGRPAAAPADDADEVVAALEAMLANLPEEQRAELQEALAELTPEQRQEYLERLVTMAETQQQVVETPIEVMVGNHAAGFYELAALHLQQQPPNLPEAKVAIDALAGMLGAVAGRLGEHEGDLKAMLSQIQLAFVQIQGAVGGEDPDA